MKLLFFIKSLNGGGAERVLSTVCNALAERGHEIYLATNLRKPIAYEIDKRIKMVELFPKPHLSQGVVKRYFSLYKNIRHTTRVIKPDVIISFMTGMNVHVILSTLFLKLPVVASEHFTFDTKHNFVRYLSRFQVNKLAQKVILLTKHDYDFLGKKLSNKIVIPNPLSYEIFEEVGERKPIVLAAGSIDRWEHKGFDNLIKIWSKVYQRFPEWRLEIAGSGSPANFNYLKALALELGVSDSVNFLGFQADMRKVFQNRKIFVLSSRYEGLPMVLMEAMSQGCVCVSFDCVSGPSEIIDDGLSGLLVENQNLSAMERALCSVIESDALCKKLQRGGLIASQKFSKDKIIDAWEDMLNSLLKS